MPQEEEAPAYEGNVPEPTMYRNYKGYFLRMDGWQEGVFRPEWPKLSAGLNCARLAASAEGSGRGLV